MREYCKHASKGIINDSKVMSRMPLKDYGKLSNEPGHLFIGGGAQGGLGQVDRVGACGDRPLIPYPEKIDEAGLGRFSLHPPGFPSLKCLIALKHCTDEVLGNTSRVSFGIQMKNAGYKVIILSILSSAMSW